MDTRNTAEKLSEGYKVFWGMIQKEDLEVAVDN